MQTPPDSERCEGTTSLGWPGAHRCYKRAKITIDGHRFCQDAVRFPKHRAIFRELRTFWLSFGDGGKNLGVAIVQVSAEDWPALETEVKRIFPVMADPVNGVIVAVATLQAKLKGCNPGGSVLCFELTGKPLPPDTPIHRLMQKPELIKRGLVEREKRNGNPR